MTTANTVSPQQRAFFEDQGYLVVENLLSPAELEECRQEIRRLHKVAADLEKTGDTEASLHFQREPFAAGVNTVDGYPVLRKIEETYRFSPVFERLAAHPKLVPVVQGLLDKDLLLFRSTLMLKPAHHGSIHALHQDSSYWPMHPPKLMTVSIALTDSTPENGCFQVIPKSHEWGMLEWGTIWKKQDDSLSNVEGVDTSKLMPVPLEAGSVLLFHSLLVHGSGPNRSPNPRNTALYAYFSPAVTYKPGKNDPPTKTCRVIAGMGGKREHTFVAEPATV